ncbi:flagellar hook-basal body complex protein FliE [Caulobacter sp. DWR1-3-2b1]|uniref:flagellar hook-basal body complex protein FliE n=1 Tax=Caulobacter sp. DWR1-3-2b1 TaxID=2804670 RepID=UPI003CE8AC80
MTIAAIEGVSAALGAGALAPLGLDPAATVSPRTAAQGPSFAQMLLGGLDKVNSDVLAADAAAQAFALDDSIPLHQVTFALEQARLSVELMMQVRARLMEGYQELLRMQL